MSVSLKKENKLKRNKKVIEFKNVSKFFGKNIILKSQSFSFDFKKIVGLIGPSGAGKSTILNMLTGLLEVDCGKINYVHPNLNGNLKKLNISKRNKILRSLIGYSTQESSFYDNLSVFDNLDYFGSMFDIKKKERLKEINILLKEFNLFKSKNIIAKNLSVGMKKRLDIALALIHNPQILVLDEPTANLDIKLRDELIPFIKKINSKRDVTVIYVSHNLEEIKNICDEVLMLNEGSVKMFTKLKNIENEFKEFIKNG